MKYLAKPLWIRRTVFVGCLCVLVIAFGNESVTAGDGCQESSRRPGKSDSSQLHFPGVEKEQSRSLLDTMLNKNGDPGTRENTAPDTRKNRSVASRDNPAREMSPKMTERMVTTRNQFPVQMLEETEYQVKDTRSSGRRGYFKEQRQEYSQFAQEQQATGYQYRYGVNDPSRMAQDQQYEQEALNQIPQNYGNKLAAQEYERELFDSEPEINVVERSYTRPAQTEMSRPTVLRRQSVLNRKPAQSRPVQNRPVQNYSVEQPQVASDVRDTRRVASRRMPSDILINKNSAEMQSVVEAPQLEPEPPRPQNVFEVRDREAIARALDQRMKVTVPAAPAMEPTLSAPAESYPQDLVHETPVTDNPEQREIRLPRNRAMVFANAPKARFGRAQQPPSNQPLMPRHDIPPRKSKSVLSKAKPNNTDFADPELIDESEFDFDFVEDDVEARVSLSSIGSALAGVEYNLSAPPQHSYPPTPQQNLGSTFGQTGSFTSLSDQDRSRTRSQSPNGAFERLNDMQFEDFNNARTTGEQQSRITRPSDLLLNERGDYNWKRVQPGATGNTSTSSQAQPQQTLQPKQQAQPLQKKTSKSGPAGDVSAWREPGSLGNPAGSQGPVGTGVSHQFKEGQASKPFLERSDYSPQSSSEADSDEASENLEDDEDERFELTDDAGRAMKQQQEELESRRRIAVQRAEYRSDLRRPISAAPAYQAMSYVDDVGDPVPQTEEQQNYLVDFAGFNYLPFIDHCYRTDGWGRSWHPKCVLWASPNVRYQPIYFEDSNVERFGARHRCAQPLLSAVHFFASTVRLPYRMALDPMHECKFAAGYGRPGNRYCYQRERLVLDRKAITFQALLATGLVFALP